MFVSVGEKISAPVFGCKVQEVEEDYTDYDWYVSKILKGEIKGAFSSLCEIAGEAAEDFS